MKLRPAVPILSVLAAGALGLACADIGSPNRSTEAYEWRLFPGIAPGMEDTLSFSWPASRLPVRVWAEDSLGLPEHVEHGIETWEAAFLYGEFDAVLVPDSAGADILVRIGSPISVGLAKGFRSAAPECEGGTTLDLPDDSREIQPPIRVFVNPRFDPSTPGVNECLALTTTHELGHAIGIFAHSPVATDLMYSDPTVSVLSERDRSTAELAYHVEPTLTVAPR